MSACDRLAGSERDAGRDAVLHNYRIDLFAITEFAALPLDEIDETLDQRSRAAHGEMHAPALLQEWDEAIDRAGAERVAADQQRMETEDGAQPLVANILGHKPVDAAMPPEPDEIPGDARHVGEELNGASPSRSNPIP